MTTPAAEVDIDVAMVRALLREQHPDLADLSVRLVGNGWDNAIFRLGDNLVVRLPRRQVAAVLVEHEQRWLPDVAERVTTRVPTPVRVGVPSAIFGWYWSVVPWFEGELASTVGARSLDTVAGELALFVREIHTPAPSNAPSNPVRGVPLASRAHVVQDRLASGMVPRPAEVAALWQRALHAAVWPHAPVWLHGDLHPANLLVSDGHLVAVIDFGDICGGDPATDLAIAWLAFDHSGRERFRNALDYDDATWLRAEGWAIVMAPAILTNSEDNAAMHGIGSRALEEMLRG